MLERRFQAVVLTASELQENIRILFDLFVCFSFEAIADYTQDLLLALSSGIAPGRVWGLIQVP